VREVYNFNILLIDVTMKISAKDTKGAALEEKTIEIKRVSKKVTGGNSISFTALVGVGDGQGKVGIGLGRAKGVPDAISKAARTAKANLVTLPLRESTISRDIEVKLGAAHLIIKPAPHGSGIIAGGPLRPLFALAGVRDVSAKILGTRNKTRNAQALIKAIKLLSGSGS